MRKGITRLALLLSLAAASGIAQTPQPVDMSKRTKELQDLKWGMFICWSFSTFSEKEWTPGIKDISFFRAKEVDTDQWARTAKEAGMGYILFLTKHHDGFCLWDTKTTDRKVTKAPLGKDVLSELKKSCDKYGIKLALYFSEGEFDDNKNYHPGGYTPEMKKAQLKELLTQYGPIEYIWFDHAQTDGGLNHVETTAWCKQFQPGCFIGYNHGQPSGDIRIGEMGSPSPIDDVSGSGFGANDAKKHKGYLVAEFTYPILPEHQGGAQWFYSLPKHDNLCLPAEKLYKDYLGAVKYGNIFSIDVGPDYSGKLRDIDVATLRKVGEMIKNPPPPSLSEGKPITASSIWDSSYDAAKAYDHDEATRWGAKADARSGWLEIDLGKEMAIGRAVVMEIGYPRTQEFVIEYKAGDEWKPLHRGTTLAGRRAYDFPTVTARMVRLNILKAKEVPSIEEFHVYAPGAKLPEAIEKAQKEESERMVRTEWFREAKFGMFITWGLYSVPAGTWKGQELKHEYGEWIEWALPIPHDEYAGIAKTWEPKQFDADAWVKTAKDAGMKYLLLTAKFHDGFLMYPSKVTAYNIYDCTPWKRDPVKELGDACARQGLKFGVYWNHAYDWQHPNGVVPPGRVREGGNFDKYIDEVALPQLKEMLMEHPQISFIWFDQGGSSSESTYERGKKFADLIRSIRPEIIFNSRLGAYPSDYRSMGDNALPNELTDGAWESACTINHTWGYKAQDTDFKSAPALIFNLVDIVSKGGNYILNVGPTGDGVIPAPEIERLQAMGAWLKVNGEAIYGAGRTPFGDELGGYDPLKKDSKEHAPFIAKTDWRCTTKPGKLYFHLFKWPGAAFEIGVTSKVAKAYLLTDRKPLPFKQDGGRIVVSLPEKPASALATVLCIDVKEE